MTSITNDMDTPHKSAHSAFSELLHRFNDDCQKIAAHLRLNDAHVYRARQGDITPTMRRALIEKGMINGPRKRVRFAADVSPDLRDEITAEARRCEITNGALLKCMWDYWIDFERNDDGMD